MSLGTRKRSWRRAQNRAVQNGSTMYRGRKLTKQSVLSQRCQTSLNDNAKGFDTVHHNHGRGPSTKPKPGQQQRASRVRVFNWNAGGLSGDVFESIQLFLEQSKIEIATIQETHWHFSSEWSTHAFYCIHSGCSKKGVGGCLTMISHKLCSSGKLRFQEIISGRLLHVCFPGLGTTVHIINLYQHFCLTDGRGGQEEADGPRDRRADVWHRLDLLLASFAFRHVIVLAGDFNSKLRPSAGYVGQAVGTAGRETEEELQQILVTHQLSCLNTWCKMSSYSCMGPTGSKSVIDFIAIRLGQADGDAKAVQHLYRHPFSGQHVAHHVPLVASVPLLWRCWAHAQTNASGQVDVQQFLLDVACKAPRYDLYLNQVRLEIHKLDEKDLDLDKAVRRAAILVYPLPASPARVASNYVDKTAVQQGWRLWRQLQGLTQRSLTCLFRAWRLINQLSRQRRHHRAARRQRRRNQLLSFVSESAAAAARGDQRALHKLIRQLAPKQKRHRMQIRGRHGYVLSEADEIAEVQQHMYSLYVDAEAPPLVVPLCSRLPFQEVDILQAIKNLPTHKATPSNCAKSAFVKHTANILAPELHKRMSESWVDKTPVIPTSWKSSWLCWLPKPHKDLTKMTGWRGISLQNAVGKAVLKAIERQVRADCDEPLKQAPQFAYSSGRGTGEALFRALTHQSRVLYLSSLCNITPHDRAAGKRIPLLAGGFQVCLDVDKAFDRVSRTQLMSAVQSHKVSADAGSLVISWHDGTPYVSLHHPSASVMSNVGVRQGCVAAPVLWNLFIDDFLRLNRSTFPVEWLCEHLTIFADDIHLFFEVVSEETLQSSLLELRRFLDALKKHGLMINMEKTAFLLHLRGRRACKWRSKLIMGEGKAKKVKVAATQKDGDPLYIPLVTHHKYLGIILSYKDGQMATLQHRKRAAQGTFARLRVWWGSRFPLKHRLRLWFQTVWPTLTYGLVDVGCTSKGLMHLNSLVFRQLRQLARSPVHITRESNEALCARLGICNPADMLCSMVFSCWERRLIRMSVSSPSDILHSQRSMCQSAIESERLLHSWWVICCESWLRTGLIKENEIGSHAVCKLLGLEAQSPSYLQLALPALPPSEAATFTCIVCSKVFIHQMALRRHMRAMHDPAADSPLIFNIALDSVGGLPKCKHCGLKFRSWQGLKQHLDKDTCLYRDKRLLAHSSPPQEVCDLPLVCDLHLRAEIQDHGAESLLDNAELCKRLKSTCVICTRWCPTQGALSYHTHEAHKTDQLAGREWARSRLNARALKVTNPCSWCEQPFAPSTVRHKHLCSVLVQLGILARRAELQVPSSQAHADGQPAATSAAATSAAAAETRRCRRNPWSVSGDATQHDRQHQESSSHRGRAVTKAAAAAAACRISTKETSQCKPQRRLRCKTRPPARLAQQQQQQQQQQQFSRSTLPDNGKSGGETRRQHQSHSHGHRLCDPLGDECANIEITAGYLEKMEGGKRDRQTHNRLAAEDVVGAVLLLRGPAAVQDHRGLRPRQRQPQAASQGPDHRRAPQVLHDEVGCGQEGDHQDRGRTRSHRTSSALRDHDPMAETAIAHPQIPQHTSTCSRVPRSQHKFLAGTEPSTLAGQRDVAHYGHVVRSHYLGSYQGSHAQSDLATQPASRRSADTHQSGDEEIDATGTANHLPSDEESGFRQCAWHRWLQNGRNDVPLARLHNPGNLCYGNSVIAALVVCHHHCHHHRLCSPHAWGPLPEIIRCAKAAPLQQLWHVPAFVRSMQNWPEPERQHDVAEFVQHLSLSIPLLQMPSARRRIDMHDEVMDVECPIALRLDASTCNSLQSCVESWHMESGGIQALQYAPPLLVIPVARFDYHDRLPIRIAVSLHIEPATVDVPVYLAENSIHTERVNYRMQACILHTGISPANGHYRMLAATDGGYVITDDDRLGCYYANPPEKELENITLLFMIRSDCLT